ncbi:phosphotransferase enzyme family protein [Cucurbitaria berberidis CBS 394.84]|uniref:Phosphotransferase enzyme family protein n=1 Tax=Cucurbitaria berberidis CBS 394.84 TaxID=1168544 RepID=A0A9P4GAP2_9PLEO|nr:phosphotransferase enzyme family protein [Cucurbitaria berberidis CBS 394.84]KAF1842086.1 phosphotransferase enzyme family protein [Cucurbitaria berberidis CBS 394.84]
MAQTDTIMRGSIHDLGALYRFTSGRWLWGEREQLAARYVKFDLQKLCRLAASSIGSDSCAKAVKIAEGQYNKVLLLTMNDGKEAIAKLPNPNAGRPHFTTSSEVATMNFLRSAHLPIPQIYAWNSGLVDNPVGAEYIIMEKQPGIVLNDLWDNMEGPQKAEILKQVIEIEKKLASIKFTKFGGLYYKQDLPQSDSTTPLYIDGNGNAVHSAEFEIGPTNHRSFFDFGRGALDIDRGPWSTIEKYVAAVAYREIACVEKGLKYPRMPEGLFYGPRQYQPSTSTKMSALNNYLKVAPYVLPEEEVTHAAVLWHGDLHTQNIFVDPENPARIIGIIDWQTISACPLFSQVTRPGFLDFNGPIPKDLGKVSLPENFDRLSPDEQREAKALQQSQTLHNIYMVRCYRQNPQVFLAMQQKDSLRHQVTVVPGTVLMDYETYLNNLLRDVEKEWLKIVGQGSDGHPLRPCPLHFSAAEVEQQEKDEELWAQGVELMNNFITDVGGFKHWDGRVSNEDYETIRDQLASGIQQFLDREARSAEERDAWLKALPFVNDE